MQREMDTHTFHFRAQILRKARSKQTDDDDDDEEETAEKGPRRRKSNGKTKEGQCVFCLVVQLIRALVRLFLKLLVVTSLFPFFSLSPLSRQPPLSLISCFLCTPFSLRPLLGACVVGIKNRVLWCEKV